LKCCDVDLSPSPCQAPAPAKFKAFALAALILAMAGCGGSADEVRQASAAPRTAKALSTAAAASSYAISVDQLFDWAEAQYSSLFAAGPQSFALPYNNQQFTVRAYAGARYLGAADGVVYGLGDFTGGQLQSFGQVQSFACQVAPAACLPAPSAWSAATTTAGEFVNNAKVVSDDFGHALAFWVERPAANGFAEQIMVSRRLAGAAWGAPQPAQFGREALAPTYKVAIDGQGGRAVLVWSQLTSVGAYDLWARNFDPRAGWGVPTRIEESARGVGDFDVGIDAKGHAIVVWLQGDAPPQRAISSLWSNRFVPGQGWGVAQRIEAFDVNFGSEGTPSLAVAANGDAHVVWISASQHIVANRFQPASGWGAAVQVVTDAGTSQSFYTPRVGADAQGNALLAWVQLDIGTQALQRTLVKRFSGSWLSTSSEVGAPQAVVNTVAPLHLSVGAGGAAALAWAVRDGAILASVAPTGGAFATPVAVKPAGTAEISSAPQTGVDGAGNAFVSWLQRDIGFSATDVWLNRFAVGSGWGASSRQESSQEPALAPDLSVNTLGRALLVWPQALSFNGPTRVMTRSFL
jgi:hypothetical protein